jgi:Uma2 family endonuclease
MRRKVYGDNVGIVLPNGNVRSPDMTFVRKEKLPEGRSPESFGRLIPDLTVEVLSPGDSAAFVGQKIGEYLECGVPLVWLADPAQQTVTIYRSLTQTERLAGNDIVTADPVLPGFTVPIAEFFR